MEKSNSAKEQQSKNSISSNGEDTPLPQKSSKIFVGGLPQDITNQELAGLLDQFGILTSIHLPTHKKKKKIKGYAIVGFKNPESVELAIRHLNGAKIRGKAIAVKVALSSDEASRMTKEMQKRKLFVKNLPLVTNEQEIGHFFGQFGKVDKVQMAYSNENKQFKGIAYITMSRVSEIERILGIGSSFDFKGKLIVIERSKAIGKIFEERHQRNLKVTGEEKKVLSQKKSKNSNKKSAAFKGAKLLKKNSSSTYPRTKAKAKMQKKKRKHGKYSSDWKASKMHQHCFKPVQAQQSYEPQEISGHDLIQKHNLLFKNSYNRRQGRPAGREQRLHASSDHHNQGQGQSQGSMFNSQTNSNSPNFDQNLKSQYLDISSRGLNNTNYRFNIAPSVSSYSKSVKSRSSSEGEEDNSLVVRQTIRTEYRIKDTAGVVYLGEINEVNVWSSGQEEEGNSEGGAEE